MSNFENKTKAWHEKLTLPTYSVGKPDKNPMFLEKRVYQGSSGKVYPHPVIDKIYDEKHDEEYDAVWLENEYLRVMILPQLGGRIQRAIDKTNNYDFVYYNEVIKPALVGLTGPWISGGIEFNWPQHHRPTTYAPTDCVILENNDGSTTVQVSEVDQMYGTKGIASFTLYPGKAYIEIKGQLYNRTPLPQTFLWWANPAVAVNDNTQSIFPPDVHAVMDHGKRDVSGFPIATGVYYKHDYSEGVDISRYKNIPVPTSYMAYSSDYNFVGGYDHSLEAGILHVADHHISPGKKQWTWGCGDFGKAWDRNLTDENGPYIELMTGVFTDNQPDFTWLKPFEEKVFTQYFMPYKKAANVKNASADIALNLELHDGIAHFCVYASAVQDNALVELSTQGKPLYSELCSLSPKNILTQQVAVNAALEQDLTLSVYDSNKNLLLSYSPQKLQNPVLPTPAQSARLPKEIATNEELYLTGLHLEQYRHATYLPEDYYQEALLRDAGDSRANTAYGTLLLRRGLFEQAQLHFEAAIARLTQKSPNPYDSEAYLQLGITHFYQKNDDKAFDAFYKSTWSAAQQEVAFYYLAAIACRRKSYTEALGFMERALVRNSHNLKAGGLKATILQKLGNTAAALAQLTANICLDAFDYRSRLEKERLEAIPHTNTLAVMGDRASSFIECAIDYADAGLYDNAVYVLQLCKADAPLVQYYLAYYSYLSNNKTAANTLLKTAASCSSLYCFPNRIDDIAPLTFAIEHAQDDAKAPYYLACLYYDKRRYDDARQLWSISAKLDASFPTVWRNLALVEYNHCVNDLQKAKLFAKQSMETAFALDKTDARILLELTQLYKKLQLSPTQRLAHLEENHATVLMRDDLCAEYITLLNLCNRYDDALKLLTTRKFHPWEGGEGKVTRQYAIALISLALEKLTQIDYTGAAELLQKALVFPHNLGEGKLEGSKDNDIYFFLGQIAELTGDTNKAKQYFANAAMGESMPSGSLYYNDQPVDMILFQGLALLKLGNVAQANARLQGLIDYGQQHLQDEPALDYFAVSLPELQLFDEDLTLRNKAHCHFLIALGSLGLGMQEKAQQCLAQVISLDCAHTGAVQLQSQIGVITQCLK